jgi:hypothetical protein
MKNEVIYMSDIDKEDGLIQDFIKEMPSINNDSDLIENEHLTVTHKMDRFRRLYLLLSLHQGVRYQF